ncbi:OmpH family outer membrane protein [Aquirufa nivalisilvae]|nr:OmpH family outer membrane protein [Aquirufa nivalisilvae]
MKKSIFFLILMLTVLGQRSYAQKFGYIDTEFITSKMPEYKQVQGKIDQMTKQWIQEISSKNEEVAKLEREYKLEELLLTEDLRQQRLSIIRQKDNEARSFQNKIFGAEGELFKFKQAALKPVLDEVSKAVEKVVRQKRLDFLFDKANDGLAMIYTNPVHDYSDYVLEELGLELDPNLVDKATDKSKPVKEN